MRIDDLQVELRPRSSWEAVELGMALARRHARAIWLPWLIVSLPVLALVNAVAWALDLVWVAALAMWWLKPVFERVPLYVLSRAVFGATPGLRETLAAQRQWGWRPMLHYLTWRRPGPARSLYLPVDLLEGGPRPGERRRVLGGPARGIAVLLTLVCANFEIALAFAAVASVLVFVPTELLSESARAMWALLAEQPPPWAQVLLNAVGWLAATAIGPFYVGAGLGLYLNRRTQIEAWDVELAFRRLRRRLQAAVVPLLAVLLFAGAMPARATPAVAAPAPKAAREKGPAPTELRAIFGAGADAAPAFERAVQRAYRDPLLGPRERATTWEPRRKDGRDTDAPSGLAAMIAGFVGLVGEAGLWTLLAIVVVMLVWTAPRWWPRLGGWVRPPPARPSPVQVEAMPAAGALPADVPAAARALWNDGRFRRALALVYRASVESMAARTGASLVPGATEAECLRAARALREPADRDAFAQAVRVWQYAAYAERLPARDEFEALLGRLSQRFGWPA